MAVVAEDGIADVVVMRGLDMIEQDHVLQLDAVADNTVSTDECGASDESAMTHLSIRSDDAGSAEISRREDLRSLVDPDSGLYFFVVLSQRRTQGKDQILDPLECFPRIGEMAEIICREGMFKIVKVIN